MNAVVPRQLSDGKMRSSTVGAGGHIDEPSNLPSRQVTDIADSHVALGIRGSIEWIDPEGVGTQIRALDDFGIALLRAHRILQLMNAPPQKAGKNSQRRTANRDDKLANANVADKFVQPCGFGALPSFDVQFPLYFILVGDL